MYVIIGGEIRRYPAMLIYVFFIIRLYNPTECNVLLEKLQDEILSPVC